MGDQQRYQVIISTADGRVFESEVSASSAVAAVCLAADQVDVFAVVTNVHARHVNGL